MNKNKDTKQYPEVRVVLERYEDTIKNSKNDEKKSKDGDSSFKKKRRG